MHKAAFRGAVESFQVLMSQYYMCSPANMITLNQIDSNGNTALAIAIMNHQRVFNLSNGTSLRVDNQQIIESLIEAGANTKLVNNEKNSLAHLVCLSTFMNMPEKQRLLKLLSLNNHEFSEQKNIYNQAVFDLLKNSTPDVGF